MKYLKGFSMTFFQILKNYLFSNNFNLVNPSNRFSSIFYKRFIVDFLLRIFTFLPFSIFFLVLIKNGYFKELADTMLQSGQNVYGYLIVIFIYIPIALFFFVSLITSTLGSVLKITLLKLSHKENNEKTEINHFSNNYAQAFLSSWKNLWYLTLETFTILFIIKIIIELISAHTFTFDFMLVLKAVLVSVATSGILSLFTSLPWLYSKK